MEEYSNSWYCTFVLILTIIDAGFTSSYALASLNPVIPVIHRVYNQTYLNRYGVPVSEESWTLLLSLTMSMVFVGALFSSFFVNALVSRLTRKLIMVIVQIVNLLGYLVIAVVVKPWGSYEAFIVGRFIIGVALGTGTALFGIVVSEFCVPHRRLFYGAVHGASYAIFGMLAVVIGWPKVLGSDDLWLGVILFGMSVSIVYLACAYWLPNTPFQTLLRDGREEAMAVLKKLRLGSEHDMQLELDSVEKNEELEVNGDDEATLLEVLRTPQYRKHFGGVVIIHSYITACGMSNMLFFSDQIFLNAGLDEETVTPASIGVLALGVVVSLAGIVAVKRFDPRTILLAGGAIMIFGDALLTASVETYKREPVMSIFAVVAMSLFFIGFSFVNMSAYTFIAVLCIARTRSACLFVATIGFWLFGWFIGFISPYFQEWLGGYAFLVWMVITIAISLYVFFCVPNIAGKTESEIQKFYK